MKFHLCWHYSFVDISVSVTVQQQQQQQEVLLSCNRGNDQYWLTGRWQFSFEDIPVLVIFQFRWQYSFGDIWIDDILVLMSLQFQLDINFEDIYFFVMFQFCKFFSFNEISVFCPFSVADISVSWHLLFWDF